MTSLLSGGRGTVAPIVTATLLRRTLGHFATGVAVVSARDHRGPVAATVNSLTSVSLDPPLLLVCLAHGSRSLVALRSTGRFALSLLAADQQPLSDRFARSHEGDLWEGVATEGDPPLLVGAVAGLRCVVHELVEGGDHLIVIGRVEQAEYVDPAPEPLLFHRGRYDRLAEPPAPESAPAAPVQALIPTDAGALTMVPLGGDDQTTVSVAAVVGHPSAAVPVPLYLHPGCLIGDALGGALCPSHGLLDAALARMRSEESGVVVYHRGAVATCCRGLDRPEPDARAIAAATRAQAAAALRAVRALNLGAVRLLGDRAQAEALADCGVAVAAVDGPPAP